MLCRGSNGCGTNGMQWWHIVRYSLGCMRLTGFCTDFIQPDMLWLRCVTCKKRRFVGSTLDSWKTNHANCKLFLRSSPSRLITHQPCNVYKETPDVLIHVFVFPKTKKLVHPLRFLRSSAKISSCCSWRIRSLGDILFSACFCLLTSDSRATATHISCVQSLAFRERPGTRNPTSHSGHKAFLK